MYVWWGIVVGQLVADLVFFGESDFPDLHMVLLIRSVLIILDTGIMVYSFIPFW